jgi:hypothetical protein
MKDATPVEFLPSVQQGTIAVLLDQYNLIASVRPFPLLPFQEGSIASLPT